MQDVSDLRQHLTDVWAGVEHSIITDDAIDQQHRQTHPTLHACIWATGGHFEYSVTSVSKMLLTVIN